jgi:hypothetical protein
VTTAVRAKALQWATDAAQRVFEAGDGDVSEAAHWRGQIAEQLHGFPEVHHSVAPWPTATDADGFPASMELEQTLAAFYPEDGRAPGFFDDALWKLVAGGNIQTVEGKKRAFKKLVVDGGQAFFVPNPGLLYPAVYDLAERGLAAAKALRDFGALPQHGARCTLTGEYEWLSDDPEALSRGHGEQRADMVVEQGYWPLRDQGGGAARRARHTETLVAPAVRRSGKRLSRRRRQPLRSEHAYAGAGARFGDAEREARRPGSGGAHGCAG